MGFGARLGSAVALGVASGCTAIAVVDDGGLGGASSLTTGASSPTTTTGAPAASTSGGFATSGSAQSGLSTANGTGASGSTASGSPPCVPADCSDGVPCTIDTCNPDGTCSHDDRAPGTPGDLAEGPCEGVCQIDATCGLALYRRDVNDAVWTKEALSAVWSGANAPPPRGILAAESGTTYEAMVVVDDGMVYRRVAGAWLAPVSGVALWGFDTNAATTLYSFDNGGEDRVILWYADGGTMRARAAAVNGTVHVNDNFFDCSPSVAFPCDMRMDWGTMQGPGLTGPQWFRFEDGNVYRRVGLMFTGSTPEAMSDIWGDALTAPTSGTVRAALVVNQQEVQLVAP